MNEVNIWLHNPKEPKFRLQTALNVSYQPFFVLFLYEYQGTSLIWSSQFLT